MPAVATAAGLPSRLGKYELLLPLAAGGMARIYIGRSTGIGQFERHVVLKMITPERANDLTTINMFLDEARLAASLNHQNVAQVFEVGAEEGVYYLAMEYVHGQDLRALLAKAGTAGTRIPLELALTVVAGAAAGLNHAHERRGPDGVPLGIVHRDVSPSNIMIGYDGAVKLLDFGIAKATQRSVETQSGIIKGKFAYMAPEQCRGRDVDRRSDVFSLGIILYEVTTQHRCFRADSDFDTMHRIVTGDVVRPTRLVQGYPAALEAIVMKALATEASQRYQSAGLLLEALESLAVSSRMSLSTMGLGRFMRDMFGEVQEPWLNARGSRVLTEPLKPKENTISSTDGHGSAAHARDVARTVPVATRTTGDGDGDRDDEDESDLAKTILQMPRDAGADDAGWNGGTPAPPPRPTPQPFTPGRIPPGGVPTVALQPRWGSEQLAVPIARMTPAPASLSAAAQAAAPIAPMHGTQPSPAPNVLNGQFSPSGSSGSAPAILSTKHGYASAAMSRGDAPYASSQAPSDARTGSALVQLKPNGRPLLIGIAIAVVGIVVILAVTLGGDDPEPAAAPPSDESAETTPAANDTQRATPAPGPGSDSVLEQNMVSIVIHSDPSGADVLIAGAKIGVTPFEKKVKRGTKVQTLTVHKEGYVDFTGNIDLAAEYENRSIKLDAAADAGSGSAAMSSDSGSGTSTSSETKGSSALGGMAGATKPAATPSTPPTPPTTTTTNATTSKSTATNAITPTTPKTTTTPPKTSTTTPKTITTPTTMKATSTSKPPTSSGTKSSTSSSTKSGATGSATKSPTVTKPTTSTKPKCQPPGPNVDPFGLPVCRT